MPIRFLHAADLHLGWRTTRFHDEACKRIGEARFTALDNLRAKAMENRVDFVLVAGDVFDDHSVSKTVAERAFTVFEGKSLPCPVYIIPGNHDPLTPGGVWDREPWARDQPAKHTFILREAAPVTLPHLPVTLFPCPLRHRNSIDDPTAWIANHPRPPGDRTIRIGLAHGSLAIMPNLPEDDHLIRPDAADAYGLDFLALGHWHKPLRHASADGIERTAYCGTHEPMRFPGSRFDLNTGWIPYSADGDAERFRDNGHGAAHLVTIDEPGAPPQIETIEIGRLRWAAEERDVSNVRIGELISAYAQRDGWDRTVLDLRLTGVLEPEQFARMHGELREIIEARYYPGSRLDAEAVMPQPSAEQLQSLAGDGVLGRILTKLHEESQSPEPATKRIAEQALKVLYTITFEEQAR